MDLKFLNKMVFNNFVLTTQIKDYISFILNRFSSNKKSYSRKKDSLIPSKISIFLTTRGLLN